jgi:hypothetical protein
MDNSPAVLFAQGAPSAVRRSALVSALPGLGATMAKVSARPAAIRRMKVDHALRLIEAIVDPTMLADILDVETRTTVRLALTRHWLYARIPHRRLCERCRDSAVLDVSGPDDLSVLLRDRTRRDPRLGWLNLCETQVINSLHAQPLDAQPLLWQAALDGVLARSPRLLVEIAAGRTPLDPGLGVRNPLPGVRLLLDRELTPTPELLELGARSGHIPAHWGLSDEDWQDICANHAYVALTALDPPLAGILAAWESLSADLHIWTLRFASTFEEIQSVLARVREGSAGDSSASQHSRLLWSLGSFPKQRPAPDVFALMERYPELSDADRLTLVELVGCRKIGDFLTGECGPQPRISEIGPLVTRYLTATGSKDGSSLVALLATVDPAANAMVSRRLAEEALQRCEARTLFSFEGLVSAAAHAYVWSRIDSPTMLHTFIGLLPEWGGTLHELVDTVCALEHAPVPAAKATSDRTL